ncbi:hypothetical protein GCM10007391_25440 [Alteromonas halophila]|uniref:Uncharacterized protein n=1 Tax=Alteromonas halophila TaxID=516698 RepID=A0A918JNY7_9ALTE|nr:hypothetical protein GCM10007391_25440 [Alteromonas halophila]
MCGGWVSEIFSDEKGKPYTGGYQACYQSTLSGTAGVSQRIRQSAQSKAT